MLCSEASLVKLDEGEAAAVTLKCRSWGCDLCQPERGRRLRALAHAGNPTAFITLTVNPDRFPSPEDRARRLADAWRVIVRRAKTKYRYKAIPFLAVFEATKRGEPHLHVIARVRWIDQKWLSEQMDALMGAPICDIRRVWRKNQVASYITKYVGKDPHRFGTCKRYWCTQDWDQEDYQPDEPPLRLNGIFDIDTRNLWQMENAWALAGWRTWHCKGALYGTSHDPPF